MFSPRHAAFCPAPLSVHQKKDEACRSVSMPKTSSGIHKIMKKILCSMLVLAGLFPSCSKDVAGRNERLIRDLEARSVTTLTIGQRIFTLEAYPYRDFMPSTSPGTRGLICVNRLVTTTGAVPSGLSLKMQFVIHGDSLWCAPYDKGTLREPSAIERVSRNGPLWEPGVKVDIIAIVHDKNTQKDYYLEKTAVILRAD